MILVILLTEIKSDCDLLDIDIQEILENDVISKYSYKIALIDNDYNKSHFIRQNIEGWSDKPGWIDKPRILSKDNLKY